MTVDVAEAAVIDTARPWPGLDAFTEVQSRYFFGLSAEADELFRRVRRDVATLLFGQSGLAQDKTKAIAEGLAKVEESPGMLWRALLDAKSRFGSTASWVDNALGDILKSEAAQKTLGTVTEAATKAAIASFVM